MSAASKASLSSTFCRTGRSQPRVHELAQVPRRKDDQIGVDRFGVVATSAHGCDAAASVPPNRSAHSPRSRSIASASSGSFTTSTRNATLGGGAATRLARSRQHRRLACDSRQDARCQQACSAQQATQPVCNSFAITFQSHGVTHPSMSVYLGIDIGTSGTKTLAINASGKILGQAMATYPSYHPKPLWSEQDPDDWWQATVKTVRAVVKQGQAQAGRREGDRPLGPDARLGVPRQEEQRRAAGPVVERPADGGRM